MHPRQNNYSEYCSLGQEFKLHYGFEEEETERKRGGKNAAKKYSTTEYNSHDHCLECTEYRSTVRRWTKRVPGLREELTCC